MTRLKISAICQCKNTYNYPTVANRAPYTANGQIHGNWATDIVSAVSAKNKMANVSSSHNGCSTIGRSQKSQRDMPRDKPELEAESFQNMPDLKNWFLHRWMR
jgi:hypothetical protein